MTTALKTTREAANLLSEIDTLLQTFSLDLVSVNSAQKIKQAFAENNLDINDKNAAAGFLTTLKESLKKLKVIKLALAFDPSFKTIENIHNFVKETIGEGYVLDIEVSENLLGGAIIMFDGKYKDFTLKKSIEDVFATQKSLINNLI